MLRRFVACWPFVAMLVLVPSIAWADVVPGPDIDATAQDSVVEVYAQLGQQPSRTSGSSGSTAPVVARRVVVGCPGNAPTLTVPLDALCPAATAACAGAGDRYVLVWIFTGPPGVAAPEPAQWRFSGQACVRQTDLVAGNGPVVVTGEDLARLPLPAAVVHVQPGNGRTLVNVPTNVFLDARPVVIPTVVLGAAVRVRATPARFRWSFGDGATLETTDPGAPYPDLRTTHTYTRRARCRWG